MMTRECDQCGKSFEAKRSTAKYCGSTCRARRATGQPPVKLASPADVTPLPRPDAGERGPVAAATLIMLTDCARESTPLGVLALHLAATIDDLMTPANAKAALAKSLRETLAEAVKGANVADNPVDELRRKRDLKRAAV